MAGCIGTNSNTEVQVEEIEKKPIEELSTKEADIIERQGVNQNLDLLESFIDSAEANQEEKIRVVKYYTDKDDPGSEGAMIYELKSRYDENADQKWIEVKPDYTYYEAEQNEEFTVLNYGQQCSSITTDEEQIFYVLRECHSGWEYRLVPTKNGV
ncbi:DUF4362 domain-containing protein [Halobacillus sp. Marseille-Q1614]|uniref:DUF4362 domain-containing protein n=1 Tax=Halobacillus sp. Marseille-Q1614 TaxID=2709134 RepID=UPI00156F158F|nr:DUF4362 domain-containing protein [Halobacillus sp. Marseille-Q1614]